MIDIDDMIEDTKYAATTLATIAAAIVARVVLWAASFKFGYSLLILDLTVVESLRYIIS